MRNFKLLGSVLMAVVLTIAMCACGAPLRGVSDDARQEQQVREETNEGSDDTVTEQQMDAYLFVHFVGSEGDADQEQIYFSVSRDGIKWQTLNGVEPILTSTVGELGVRDPHIIRKADGTGFYLIATDLSIYYRGGNWGESQTAGSHSIVIWESEDLVEWSEPRLREIARANAGCTWAPESIWDEEQQAYMVFWASKTSEDWTHRIYRCYTTDFDTFTAPEVYMEGDVSLIDTTFIKEGDTYYRFTKNEAATYVYMEKSTSLSGDFEAVSTFTINGASASTYTGYEGPTIYKLNDGSGWCLLLDNYGKSAGYKPFVTSDITKGRFTSGTAFDFGGTTFRHGTVIPITAAEYAALVKQYPESGPLEEGDLVVSLKVDGSNVVNTVDNAVGTVSVKGTLNYSDGAKTGSQSVQFANNNNYIAIETDASGNHPLKGLKSCTVSFAMKTTATATSWWFYAAPASISEQTYGVEKYIGMLTKADTALSIVTKRYIQCERYNNSGSRSAAVEGTWKSNTWQHITIVYRNNMTTLYIDGELIAREKSTVNLATMLGDSPVIQLGKANWGSGEYASGYLDAFRIHNYALSTDEIAANYKDAMGIAA